MTLRLSPTSTNYSRPDIDSNHLTDVSVPLIFDPTQFALVTSTPEPAPQIRTSGNSVRYLIGSFITLFALTNGSLLFTFPSKVFAPLQIQPFDGLEGRYVCSYHEPGQDEVPLVISMQQEFGRSLATVPINSTIHFHGITYITNMR